MCEHNQRFTWDKYKDIKCLYCHIEALEAELSRYRKGIIDCLDANGHLADGDNCTLIELKRLVPEWDEENEV